MAYQYGRNGQAYVQGYEGTGSYGRRHKAPQMVVQPEVPLDSNMVMPYVAAGAIAGIIAFVINPVMGIIAFFFGGRGLMMMHDGNLDGAAYSAKVAFWFSFFSLFMAYAAYVVLIILKFEKPDLITSDDEDDLFDDYLPRVLMPMFSWVL